MNQSPLAEKPTLYVCFEITAWKNIYTRDYKYLINATNSTYSPEKDVAKFQDILNVCGLDTLIPSRLKDLIQNYSGESIAKTIYEVVDHIFSYDTLYEISKTLISKHSKAKKIRI